MKPKQVLVISGYRQNIDVQQQLKLQSNPAAFLAEVLM
jgi:hypothetical protein